MMIRKLVLFRMCGLIFIVPVAFFMLATLMVRCIPIDDPSFEGQPIEHWLARIESSVPAERQEATRVLSTIFTHPDIDEPLNGHPLSGLSLDFQRQRLIYEHHSEFVSRFALRISNALEKIARADNPPQNAEALLGLSYAGANAGLDEQRRVLPVLVAACENSDPASRRLAIGNLITALGYFHGYPDYSELPASVICPLITEVLHDEEYQHDAVHLLGMFGKNAGSEALTELLKIAEDKSAEPGGHRSATLWAIKRVRGEE